MTKAPLGCDLTGPNPTDRAKRGVKRSVLVEGHGVPLGVAVDGANRNDAQDGASDVGKYSHRSRHRRRKRAPSIYVWIKATIMTKYGSRGRNLAIPCIFDPAMKKHKRSHGKSDSKLDVGWWNARTVG
jgi:hypothetical protein